MWQITELLTRWRDGDPSWPGLTEVFLAALGTDGSKGFQCELGFGDGTTRSFQAAYLPEAIGAAHRWAARHYGTTSNPEG